MSEFEHMEKLRLENKKLLERLKVKQGEFGGMDPGKRKSYLQSALGSANYADKLLDQGNNRQRKQFMKEVKKPKSILITPLKDDTKEAAAFLSSPKEVSVPLDSWAVRPLLGYDWIAGLLDMDSSLSEKSEQFFSELHEFRQVNRNECVQDLLTSEILDISAEEDHKEISLNSHPCVYCYRVNKRLFLNPVSSESCPVCKTKRNQQHWTVGEEAYVRNYFQGLKAVPDWISYKICCLVHILPVKADWHSQ
ncbi:migration and invasion-inhibitory protein isoform X2 [Microcaecilia unicolor]|uniref:Migration and invasion-inhibitory protein isoform X2 n=1 Tax=Microcaecilia unicolor TaxID=1415580 RepID=A0A6P7WND9_9AMPH|nr:migration and invasion-inhibitory protein isoform X2 [Microcaecilia unicolor]